VQIELDPIRDQLGSPRVQELTHRENILLATHGHEWLGAAADIASEYPAFGPVFRRGLPEMVCLSLDTFLKRGAELFEACPTVREVSLYGVAGRCGALAACSSLPKIETLEITEQLNDEPLEVLSRLFESLSDSPLKCFRQFGCPFEHPLHQMFRLADPERDKRIELIHLSRDNHDSDEIVGAAASYNRWHGSEIATVYRPYDAMFPLAGDLGHGLYTGVDRDGEPVILAVRSDGAAASFFFDEIGHQNGCSQFRQITRESLEWWKEHRGRSIRLREFRAGVLSLSLWPRAYSRDYLQNPFDRPPGVTDHWWNSRGGVLRRWLHEGRFVIEWDGREYTLDASGKIIASEAAG
jgi:hypothetical protein